MSSANSDVSDPNLVSLLWTLKRALDVAPPGSVPGVTYVHFTLLRKDASYRHDLLDKAVRSPDPGIRELAERVRAAALASGADAAGQGADPARSTATDVRPPVGRGQESVGNGRAPRRAGAAFAVILGVVAVLAGVGVFVATKTGILDRLTQVELKGSLMQDTVLHAGHSYRLIGLVFVEGRATLSIEPGVHILGDPGAALIVTRDARLNARGTAEQPIVFTSAKPVGQRAAGDWGGVVLLGNAPVNTPVSHIEGLDREDARGFFGGGVASDSCGVMQYVRIEYAGYELSKDNELNGLTLGGCGSGTIISHVQVHLASDDGIEVFGGSANLDHIVISRSADDGLDWDRGWTGYGQFILVQMDPRVGDNGIEADNLHADHNATPRSAPTLSNVTIVGSGNPGIAQRAMVLRRGTAGDLRNVLVADFVQDTIDIRDASTVEQVKKGALRFEGLVFDNPSQTRLFEDESGDGNDDAGFDEAGFFRAGSPHAVEIGSRLFKGGASAGAAALVPEYDEALISNAAPVPQGEFWEEAANFVGAVRPGSRASWLDGWTSFPQN